LMLMLFTEIFIVTFINVTVTTIFTISLLRLQSVNLLFNKRIYLCVCVINVLVCIWIYSRMREHIQHIISCGQQDALKMLTMLT